MTMFGPSKIKKSTKALVVVFAVLQCSGLLAIAAPEPPLLLNDFRGLVEYSCEIGERVRITSMRREDGSIWNDRSVSEALTVIGVKNANGLTEEEVLMINAATNRSLKGANLGVQWSKRISKAMESGNFVMIIIPKRLMEVSAPVGARVAIRELKYLSNEHWGAVSELAGITVEQK